ncbi:MAG: hypothetical protein BGO69_05435 [Bacteroidetes bacterium 46-16]|nr:MAG: hypothetical protein BGO69_05435 [Bacteroidetes bacterium 46-16]
MKAQCLLFPLLLGSTMAQAKNISSPGVAGNTLNFIENKGQVVDQYGNSRHDINYRLGGSGLSMFIGGGQLHYQWASPVAQFDEDKQRIALYRMDVTLVGADPHTKVVAEQKQAFYERYYTPQFGERGATAYAYQKITYENVYPNIDWVLYVKDNKVEYDFVVRPGGKVSDIQLRYDGATNLSLDKSGGLTATTPSGSITEAIPVSYQQTNGKKVASSFTLKDNIVSFSTGDYTGTLIIDPTLSWSTYYGGSGTETMRQGCVTGDNYGDGYLSGVTTTNGLATVGSYQDTVTGGTDAFLVKFNSSGVRQWATYFGGTLSENIYGIRCDQIGNVYLSGYTNSTDMITTVGAHQTINNGGTDAILVKFDSSGALQWSTYFGGSAAEQCYGINCDKDNNVYITGYTQSTSSIATIGAYQISQAGSQDGFLAKFNSAGTLKWATYYGGSNIDNGAGVSCDSSKNVFLCGVTKSTSGIATTGGSQVALSGTQDAFIAKFDSTGAIIWGTYYGGPGTDAGGAITCDNIGSIYMTGNTASTFGIATPGAVQDTFAGAAGDMFLVKFNSSGSLKWGTYYGGAGNDIGYALSYSALGYVYLAGVTPSMGLATVGTFQDTIGGSTDALVVKFDTAGNRMWATYFGAEAADYGHGVYCSPLSRIFLGGGSASYGLLTTLGCYQTSNAGGTADGYLVMFNDCILTQPDSLVGSDTVCRGAAYTYYTHPVVGALSYTWTLPTGFTGTSTTDTIHLIAGNHTDTVKVAANFACGTSTQLAKVISVSPLPTITPVGTSSICNGDSITLTSSTGTVYQWLQGGVAIVGAHSNSYTVHTGNQYSVIVTSTSGCVDTSGADTIIVHPTPVPVITASGMTLSTGTYTSYQWNRNGTLITGAISQTYTMVIESGDYTVTVVDSNGCTGTSTIYNPTVGVPNVNPNNPISVYPNPTTGTISIITKQIVNIAITGTDGRLIDIYKAPKQIDLSSLPDGIYLLRIIDDKGGLISIQKMVKAKNR